MTAYQDVVHLYASYMRFVYRCICRFFNVVGVWSFSKFLEMVELCVQEKNHGYRNGFHYVGENKGFTCL